MKRQSANLASSQCLTMKHSKWLSMLLASMALTPMIASASDSRIEQFFNQVDVDNYRGNYSIIHQIGNNNRATVNQSYSASYQRGNFSKIFQFGNFNTATIEQTDGNNFGVITQSGNEHDASINQTQTGKQRELKAHVSQSGARSDIHITQSGSGYRSINVEQRAYSGNARPVTVETY